MSEGTLQTFEQFEQLLDDRLPAQVACFYSRCRALVHKMRDLLPTLIKKASSLADPFCSAASVSGTGA